MAAFLLLGPFRGGRVASPHVRPSPLPVLRGEGLVPEARRERSGVEGALPKEPLPDTPPHPRPAGLLHRPVQADAALSPRAGRGNCAWPVALRSGAGSAARNVRPDAAK